MESERQRARRVIVALRQLPTGVLEAAVGAMTSGPYANLVARVHEALTAPDPEAALADVLREIPDSTFRPVPLAAAEDLVSASLPIRDALGELNAGRNALSAEADRLLVEALAADPSVVPLLEEAVALLGDDGPFAALRTAVEAIGGIADLLQALDRGDANAGAQLAKLRRQRAAIATNAARIAEVPALLARATEHARIRGDLAATARLAIAYAALNDDLEAWRDAFEHAIDARLLREAQRAASHIDAAAIASGQLGEIADVAAKVADLGRDLGDPAAELGAIGSQALALAQLGSGDEARALVARAHAIAYGHAAREARAHLLAGQVAEKLGDEATARIEFRKVTERARGGGVEHELGWAALHLGRLEAKADQMFRAGQDLDLAHEIARAVGDTSLLALALAARIEHAPDRASAEAVLSGTDAIAAVTRAELARRLDIRWPV